jgi:hypothetical protein
VPLSASADRVEKPAEVEENKRPPKNEYSAKRDPSAGRFFMKFRGPQALPNRPEIAGHGELKFAAAR